VIDSVVRFLQGRDNTLGRRILATSFLPGGPRLDAACVEEFGRRTIDDAAKYLATLYIEDLADLIGACVDDGFALTSYQRHLGSGSVFFAPLKERLQERTLVDRYLDELTDSLEGDVIGVSIPFPGNLYGALRIGRRLRQRGVKVIAGGGFINTELREVNEPGVWDSFDAITYDDGEGPLVELLSYYQGGGDQRVRTRTRDGYFDNPQPRIPMTSAADFRGLPLHHYFELVDTLNPAHRLWSDGRWNKMTLAHGCYWKKCSFCDIGLDYISHYEKSNIETLVDTVEEIVEDTGNSGFHFVDEAAPPAVMRAFALEVLRRRLTISWWGNIRFEKTFTPDLCRLLAAAGLIAVTGGLEVASNRLLGLMNKGVTVEQVAKAASAFGKGGVLVHAYLMYGFPTQTTQETIDSMELVRQLFASEVLHSGFWHRFVVTRHAPVFSNAGQYKIRVLANPQGSFSDNDHAHEDPQGGEHDLFDEALPVALKEWMCGEGLLCPVEEWFDTPMPTTQEEPDRIARALEEKAGEGSRLIWVGGDLLETEASVVLHCPEGALEVECSPDIRSWIISVIEESRPQSEVPCLFLDARDRFPGNWGEFKQEWRDLREAGLLLI